MPKTLSAADIEEFRARSIDVAEALFAAHGPEGVTMRQVADALGVSSMTPYRYFEDKDALLAAVRTRAFNRFAEAMENAAHEHAVNQAANARSAAKRNSKRSTHKRGPGDAYLDFALANPAAYRLMFDVNQPTYEKYPELLVAMERARRMMGHGIRDLATTGRFKGDVELAAHSLWSALHGPVMLELAGLLQPPLDARTIAHASMAALVTQLGLDIAAEPASARKKGTRRNSQR